MTQDGRVIGKEVERFPAFIQRKLGSLSFFVSRRIVDMENSLFSARWRTHDPLLTKSLTQNSRVHPAIWATAITYASNRIRDSLNWVERTVFFGR